MKILSAALVLLYLACADAPSRAPLTPNLDSEINPDDFRIALLHEAIFIATNKVREDRKRPVLKPDSILNLAAQYQAERMFREEKMEHRWPRDRKYGTLKNRLQTFKGDFSAFGENIARMFILDVPSGAYFYINDANIAVDKAGRPIPFKTYRQLGNEVVQEWLDSPPHRKNMLGDFDFLGLGVSPLRPLKKGLNFDVYLCQNFGTKWKTMRSSF